MIFVIVGIYKDKEVIVSVKDTGEGITDEVFPNLFSKFKTYTSTVLDWDFIYVRIL